MAEAEKTTQTEAKPRSGKSKFGIPKNLVVHVDDMMVMNPDGTEYIDFMPITSDLTDNEFGEQVKKNITTILRAIDKISNG